MVLYLDAAGNVTSTTPGFSIQFANSSPTFVFDETTNPTLATDVVANMNLYKVVGGNLQKSGVTQSITAASAIFTTLQSSNPSLTETQFENIMGVLQSQTATLAQVNTILFNVLLRLRKVELI